MSEVALCPTPPDERLRIIARAGGIKRLEAVETPPSAADSFAIMRLAVTPVHEAV